MRRTTTATAFTILVLAVVALAGSAAAAPPEVTIESPEEGATVSGNVTINGTASDDEPYDAGAVTEVEVRIDNGTWMQANDTSGDLVGNWDTWNLTWNSTDAADGNHTVTARATDNTGETSTDSVNVTVDNAARGDGDEDGDQTPPADVNLTVEARQTGCPGNRTWCLELTEGNLSDVDPGLRVNATFVNPAGNLGHSLYFADHDDADPGHDNTPSSAAFARIETVPGGQSGSATFTVPANATEIYLWCDESGHEGQGMYLHEPGAHGNQTDGNGTDGGEDDQDDDTGAEGPPEGDGLPAPGAVAVAAAATLAALGRRRSR